MMGCDFDEALSIMLVAYAEALRNWGGYGVFSDFVTRVLDSAAVAEVRRQTAQKRSAFVAQDVVASFLRRFCNGLNRSRSPLVWYRASRAL